MENQEELATIAVNKFTEAVVELFAQVDVIEEIQIVFEDGEIMSTNRNERLKEIEEYLKQKIVN